MTRFVDQPWKDAGVNSPNFMTPHIIQRGRSGDWAWEVSSGEGFDREPIFGATFLLWDGESWRKGWELENDPSQMFYHLGTAMDYVREVTSR